jgi:hypothetical protein
LAKKQGELCKQMQFHVQTIEILVFEKSHLHAALAHKQQEAKKKTRGSEGFARCLLSAQ